MITREHATIAGRAWVDEVFRQGGADVGLDFALEVGKGEVRHGGLLYEIGRLYGAQRTASVPAWAPVGTAAIHRPSLV
ncbi:hypothetical protein RBT90_01575 [Pseudomonas aeruginosa]|nr:hypothetical protein [Pseudomonas aeruginosa]MDQ4331336.1 hypothetical protein [Pseudomonas aeruginosa]